MKGVLPSGWRVARGIARQALLGEDRPQIVERQHRVHARQAAVAARASMPRMSAWACGLRTNAT